MAAPLPVTTDEAFLDELFDQLTEAMLQGEPFDLDARLAERPELVDSAHDLQVLAKSVIGTRRQSGHPPQRLPGFEVVHELGRGASSVVYLARQESVAGRLVALKLMTTATLFSDREQKRFAAEVRALARLRHPNVVAIFDVIESGDERGFVMEWLPGKSLSDLIRRRGQGVVTGPDDPAGLRRAAYIPWVCRVGIALADALATVHEAELLHRDVKPSNVLLRADGSAVLSDFGLVRDEEASLHTRTGSFLGTLAYAAPEQKRGQDVDARADVFGLGATLVHALTLELPGDQAAMQLPRDLRTVLEKATRSRPQDRYASAAAFGADLERVLTLQPIEARPEGLVRRSIKFGRRNRGAFLGGFLGVLLVTTVLVVVQWMDAVSRREAQRADELVEQARLALLDSDLSQRLAVRAAAGGAFVRLDLIRKAMQESVQAYEQALRIRGDLETAQLERDAVLAGLARLRGETPAITPLLARHCPRSVSLLQGKKNASVSAAAPQDLRTLALIRYLDGDLEAALQHLLELERHVGGDPFVGGLIGQVLLVMEQPERAYPRLLRISEQHPGRRSIVLAAASAAVECGDADVATRLVDSLGEPVGPREPMLMRAIRADLLWLRGDAMAAQIEYRKMNHYSRITDFHAAYGAWHRAVLGYVNIIGIRPQSDRMRRALVFAARRWWESMNDEQRQTLLAEALAGKCSSAGSVFGVLAAVQRARDTLASRARQLQPSFTHGGENEMADRTSASSSSALDRTLLRVMLDRTDFLACVGLPEATRQRIAMLWCGHESPRVIADVLREQGVWLDQPRDPFELGRWTIAAPWREAFASSLGDFRRGTTWARPFALSGNHILVHRPMVPGRPLLRGRVQVLDAATGRQVHAVDAPSPAAVPGDWIAPVGDANGDGVDDWATTTQQSAFGKSAFYVTVHSGRDAKELHRIDSPTAGIMFGRGLAGIGDVDGDGRPELAIAARGTSIEKLGTGCVFVYTLDGRQLYCVEGKVAHDDLGRHVAPLGDIDGDGAADFAVGTEPQQGNAYVLVVSGRSGTVVQTIREPRMPKETSMAVSGIGDVDGDGRRDLLVAISSLRPWDYPRGRCRVISTASWRDVHDLEGGRSGDGFGEHVAAIGDVDGDGVDDFAVTSNSEVSMRPPALHVYSGKTGAAVAELPGGWRILRLPGAGRRFAVLSIGSWTRYGRKPIGSLARLSIVELR